MSLPSGDPNIRGTMKPFQSELYFEKPAPGGPSYTIGGQGAAYNYVASLTECDPGVAITSQWAGLYVGQPNVSIGKVAQQFHRIHRHADRSNHYCIPEHWLWIRLASDRLLRRWGTDEADYRQFRTDMARQCYAGQHHGADWTTRLRGLVTLLSYPRSIASPKVTAY